MDTKLIFQRVNGNALINFIKMSLYAEKIPENETFHKAHNFRARNIISSLFDVINGCESDEILAVIETVEVVYKQYRMLYSYGEESMKALKISGR